MFGIDDAVGAGLKIVSQVIDRVIPDPAAAEAAKLEVAKLQMSGELAQLTAVTDLAKAQAATNTAEASNPNLWVAGARPAIMWICAGGLGIHLIVNPLLVWGTDLLGYSIAPPTMDVATLMSLIPGMLGMVLRTYEKQKGVGAVEPSDGVGSSTGVNG